MSSSVQSLIEYGSSGLVVDIECNLSNNLPNIVIVGFVSRAVDEARERVRGAFASSGLELPRRRITINLAPADIAKNSSGFDLAIAAAIIQAADNHRDDHRVSGNDIHKTTPRRLGSKQPGFQPTHLTKQEAVMGELGLDGAVRPVRGIIGKILAGRSRGITTFYIPAANLSQAALIPNVTLVPVTSLAELATYLSTGVPLAAISTADGSLAATAVVTGPRRTVDGVGSDPSAETALTLSDIVGQQQAKRALEIAAAGGHNLLLNGPPGTGKSMLARALPSILPGLTREEMLEVTHLHSLAGKDYDRIVLTRPFRAPHHSASHTAVIGGGSVLRPGEISLAHRGVLFFDELPEFNRPTIEALRQPLEDRRITIARANDRLEFPADFILIATANPCPCGYYGAAELAAGTSQSTKSMAAAKRCDCPPAAVQRYRAKLSGPIMDRIDLYSDVHSVDHASLLQAPGQRGADDDHAVRQRVAAARSLQAERYGGPSLNASMTNRDITRYAHITPAAKALLDTAGPSLGLSARAYLRSVKVARTIADLAGSPSIDVVHITEALQYRSRDQRPTV